MLKIKPGDIVARKKYNKDLFFKVKSLLTDDKGETVAFLKGIDVRLMADAAVEDLELQPAEEVLRYRHDDIQRHSHHIRRIIRHRQMARETSLVFREDFEEENDDESQKGKRKKFFFEVPGTVLHVDGDEEYLDKCLHAYKQLNIAANGVYLSEEQQVNKIEELLKKFTPDILVLTGHDGLLQGKGNDRDLDRYRNSRHFLKAVRVARELRPTHDDLIIFAGACQSHYEALLDAGATFASSPMRVFIHAYDPVFIVEYIAYSSISKILNPSDVIKNTITGPEGLGGVEVKGRLRLGYPDSLH